ncbi:MAG: alpha/beta fold hydrolase [Candidatus Dormibacteraceae bacterium]
MSGFRPAAIVFVHGSWHGSWCWEQVRPRLEKRGIAVRTLDLPSCGRDPGRLADLAGDTQAVGQVLDRIDGSIVVCAHSYGGAPATAAVAGHERVRHLVYLSAFMLDSGESCAVITGGSLPSWCVVKEDGTFMIDPAAAPDILYGDCDQRTQDRAIRRLVPQLRVTATQTISSAGWRRCPSTYVVCTQDHAIPPPTQRRLAERAGETVELTSSHSPFLSQPEAVAEVLADRARRIGAPSER